MPLRARRGSVRAGNHQGGSGNPHNVSRNRFQAILGRVKNRQKVPFCLLACLLLACFLRDQKPKRGVEFSHFRAPRLWFAGTPTAWLGWVPMAHTGPGHWPLASWSNHGSKVPLARPGIYSHKYRAFGPKKGRPAGLACPVRCERLSGSVVGLSAPCSHCRVRRMC